MDLKKLSVLPSEVLRHIILFVSQMRIAESVQKLQNHLFSFEEFDPDDIIRTNENIDIYYNNLIKIVLTNIFYFEIPQLVNINKKSRPEVKELLSEDQLRILDNENLNMIVYIKNKTIISYIIQSTACVTFNTNNLYIIKITIHECSNIYYLDKLLDYAVSFAKNINNEEILNQFLGWTHYKNFYKYQFVENINLLDPIEKEYFSFVVKEYNRQIIGIRYI
jgi:hypothetical protein